MLVESLGSYLHRFALLHEISLQRLVLLLVTGFPPSGADKIVLLLTSPKIESLVNQLEADGLNSGLRASSLRPLSPVLRRQGREEVRKWRAWCSFCWLDSKREAIPIFEPLIASLKVSERCPIHQVNWSTGCPSCNRKQHWYKPHCDIDKCVHCSAPLMDARAIELPIARKVDAVSPIEQFIRDVQANPEFQADPRCIARLFTSNSECWAKAKRLLRIRTTVPTPTPEQLSCELSIDALGMLAMSAGESIYKMLERAGTSAKQLRLPYDV